MITELYKLVHSLSSVEKKMFLIYSKVSEGKKDYLSLYKIILNDKSKNITETKELFSRKNPNTSFQNTISYLFKNLIKTLVILRVGQDDWFNELYGLMTARLCIERSLPNYALKTLKDTKQKAFNKQNHVISYYAERMELSLLSDLNFPNINESKLIEVQASLKVTLNRIKHIQEQLSLLEVLRLRTLQQNLLSTKATSKETQDLILNEISLISGKNKEIFISQKLHLMFQSFFFIHIAEYSSALRVFSQLNKLFEQNENLWNFPPYDYLSVLDEILKALGTMEQYSEMTFYLEKLDSLLKDNYPGHFKEEINKSSEVHTLNYLIGVQYYSIAQKKVNSLNSIFNRHIHNRKDSEIILWRIALHCYMKEWSSARKHASSFLIHMHNEDLERIGRLLFIISSYELRDLDSLDYEIRSYRRKYRSRPKLYEVEKSIFSIISRDVMRRGNNYKSKLKDEINNKIDAEFNNNIEAYRKLLRYFDLIKWLNKQLQPS